MKMHGQTRMPPKIPMKKLVTSPGVPGHRQAKPADKPFEQVGAQQGPIEVTHHHPENLNTGTQLLQVKGQPNRMVNQCIGNAISHRHDGQIFQRCQFDSLATNSLKSP